MGFSLSRRQALQYGVAAFGAAGASGLLAKPAFADANTLLNVSFDPTAQLYAAYDKLFATHWAAKTGATPTIHYSHGGSGAQARAVIEGLPADVVTLALAYDIDAIAKKGLLAMDWQSRLPNNSTPYTSTIVFLVRQGNPKNIQDWDDLVKTGVQIVAPNPKTSGGARWNVLAAWAWAQKKYGSKKAALAYLQKFFANVPVLDSGAHGSTLTFTQRKIGDVLVGWESDAYLSIKEAGAGQYEIIRPSLSILAEPPVAVVDKNATAHGSTAIATEYLTYLYSPEAQDLIGANFYRPSDPAAVAKYAAQFPTLDLVTVKDFGGWEKAQPQFFGDGGYLDQAFGASGASFFGITS
jgi:sulfate transport system substrate-binding protein